MLLYLVRKPTCSINVSELCAKKNTAVINSIPTAAADFINHRWDLSKTMIYGLYADDLTLPGCKFLEVWQVGHDEDMHIGLPCFSLSKYP